MENTSEIKNLAISINPETNIISSNTSNLKPIKIEVLNKTSLKSSQEKSLRKEIMEKIPGVIEILDKIWPKKGTLLLSRQKPYTTIYYINDEPCFVEVKDKSVVPHLKLLHKCK